MSFILQKILYLIHHSFRRKRLIEIGSAGGFLFIVLWVATVITPYHAQPELSFYTKPDHSTNQYIRAKIIAVHSKTVLVELLDGDTAHQRVSIKNNESRSSPVLHDGAVILVDSNADDTYNYVDRYRLPGLIVMSGLFVIIVLFVGRRRGLTSLIGLMASIAVLGWFIVPLIMAGYDAMWVSIFGAYLIAFTSIVVAHGFQFRTFISLGCVVCIVSVVAIVAQYYASILGLSGINDEISFYLSIDLPRINLAKVLIGGIIIAGLGVLDDIVTAQVATVDELQKANTSLSVRELYARATSVGREHIASLVNTLALVYIGASLPFIITYASQKPNLSLLFSSDYIVTEIARTLIASSGLIVAVPFSTIIAAVILHRRYQKQTKLLVAHEE